MAVGLLQDSGIEAILKSDDAGGFRHHLTLGMGNNRVIVQKKDVERALEVIKPLEEQISEAEQRRIEAMAVNEQHIPTPKGPVKKKKSKKNYSITIPLIIAVVFIVSYAFDGMRTHRRNSGSAPADVECEPVGPPAERHRICREYYKTGNPRWVFHYKGDDVEGDFKEFYDGGSLRWEGAFHKNQENGLFKEYYKNGQLMMEGLFVVGQMEGSHKEYYKTGPLKRVIPYKDNEIDGQLKTYDKSGRLVGDEAHKKGVRYDGDGRPYDGIEKTYYENGDVWEIWRYKKGRLEGLSQGYFESGRLDFELTFKRGKLHGPGRFYHENGNVYTAYEYDKDVPVSLEEYDDKGVLIFEARY